MNFTQNELDELRSEIDRLERQADSKAEEAQDILDEMREEGVNPLNDDEAYERYTSPDKEARKLRDKANDLRARYESALEDRGARVHTADRDVDTDDRSEADTIGLRFVETDEYDRFRDVLERDLETAVQTMPLIEVADRDEAKRILRTRAVTSDALIDEDRLTPALQNEHPYRPVRALDAITIGDTDSDTVEYVEEGVPSENVGESAYGNDPAGTPLLNESNYSFSEKTKSTHRIGHHTPASEKELADAGQLRTLLDTRLRGGVRRRLENLVIDGDSGAGDAFDGILTNASIAGYARDAANGESRHDAVYEAITKVRVNNEGEVEPTAVGIHPNDMKDIVLEKDGDGNYLNQRGATEPRSIWGLAPIVSTAFPEGNPLVGEYSGATLWMRTGISVTSTDSHSDWFLRGWVAVKAQVRSAFGVVLPRYFCEVTNF